MSFSANTYGDILGNHYQIINDDDPNHIVFNCTVNRAGFEIEIYCDPYNILEEFIYKHQWGTWADKNHALKLAVLNHCIELDKEDDHYLEVVLEFME